MRIKAIKLKKFRRFNELTVEGIPETTKLVVLAGPNGSGKSSLFDAFLLAYRTKNSLGWATDKTYYNRLEGIDDNIIQNIAIELHDGKDLGRGSIYVRSAYRNDPEFSTTSLAKQGEILDSVSLQRMIETDATVATNYARLASQAMEDIFVNESAATTVGAYRDRLIGEIRDPLKRLFPDLTLLGVGNPLSQGTFQFAKGTSTNFAYRNLSGGEKSAFDLILDIVVKRRSYNNTIYCIDEPEAHMNTKIQSALLQELLDLIPETSQLWIASHSIGMMRKAREIHEQNPASVAFLDFSGRNFDQPTLINPSSPSRAFWESVLQVAVDDLANLIAPREVVICEGNPAGAVQGKNAEHDAKVYSTIFAGQLPDITFISAGSSNQVSGDFLGLATALPKIAQGMKVRRLIDLDDHAPADVATLNQQGITVLSRRHLEAYLFSDEILEALCISVGRSNDVTAVLQAKAKAIAGSVSRGNPNDDVKSAAGEIYTETKKILSLTQVGNDRHAFARNTLAPLIQPDTDTYKQLYRDIFT